MRKAEQPLRSMEKTRKNFLPSLSMWKMVQRLLGPAEMEMMKLLMKTESSGMYSLQFTPMSVVSTWNIHIMLLKKIVQNLIL